MNKSIYEEALDILVNSFLDPLDEDNDCYMFNHSQMNKISKAIREAQKQEKLLELYKEINNKRKELMKLARYNSWSWKLDIEINELKDKIKEKENE